MQDGTLFQRLLAEFNWLSRIGKSSVVPERCSHGQTQESKAFLARETSHVGHPTDGTCNPTIPSYTSLYFLHLNNVLLQAIPHTALGHACTFFMHFTQTIEFLPRDGRSPQCSNAAFDGREVCTCAPNSTHTKNTCQESPKGQKKVVCGQKCTPVPQPWSIKSVAYPENSCVFALFRVHHRVEVLQNGWPLEVRAATPPQYGRGRQDAEPSHPCHAASLLGSM